MPHKKLHKHYLKFNQEIIKYDICLPSQNSLKWWPDFTYQSKICSHWYFILFQYFFFFFFFNYVFSLASLQKRRIFILVACGKIRWCQSKYQSQNDKTGSQLYASLDHLLTTCKSWITLCSDCNVWSFNVLWFDLFLFYILY